jgi:hypothetical protein
MARAPKDRGPITSGMATKARELKDLLPWTCPVFKNSSE